VQGLCTNDIQKLNTLGDCVPATFLSTKGRILTPSLLYYGTSPDGDDLTPSVLMELPSHLVPDILKHLALYKLRSKVTIKVSPMRSAFNATSFSPDELSTMKIHSNIFVAVSDPRVPQFGTRVLLKEPLSHELTASAEGNKNCGSIATLGSFF
jgi:folate-binding Fe-S cluster repair protein YgfZ